MEYRKFEQQISETLYHHKVDLDINALIQDIHGDNKKDRKAVWYWFAGIGIFVFASSFFLLSHTFSSPKSKIVAAHLTPSSVIQNSIEDENAPKASNDKNNVINTVGESKITNQSKEKTSKQLTKKDHFSVMVNESVVHNTEISNENIIQNTIEASNANELIGQLPTLDFTAIDFKSNKIIKTDKIVCPSFSNRKKLLVEIIPEVGLFLPMKKLENGANEANNIFTLRNNEEKTLEGINAGLYFQLKREKFPISLKAGLSWSKFTEKMPLNYNYTRSDTTQGIISITYSQTGDTITTIIGDIITEKRLSGSKTRHHSISLWDLPISVGLEKRFGKWFAGLEAGAIINLSMKSEGNILATDTSFVAVNVPQSHFRSSLGLSYFGGVQVGKYFMKAGRIYIAARARFIPSTFSIESNPIKQSYHFAGINLGYVWSF